MRNRGIVLRPSGRGCCADMTRRRSQRRRQRRAFCGRRRPVDAVRPRLGGSSLLSVQRRARSSAAMPSARAGIRPAVERRAQQTSLDRSSCAIRPARGVGASASRAGRAAPRAPATTRRPVRLAARRGRPQHAKHAPEGLKGGRGALHRDGGQHERHQMRRGSRHALVFSTLLGLLYKLWTLL